MKRIAIAATALLLSVGGTMAQSAGDGPNGADRPWIDLGAGAGLPGIIVAILAKCPVILIENRKGRIAFLREVTERLALGHAQIVGQKVEASRLIQPAAVISARAYAPMEQLIPSAHHLTDFSTIWLLPKGQNHQNELAIAQQLWHCEASIEPSITAPDSAILKLSHVRPRQAGHQRRSRKAGGKA